MSEYQFTKFTTIADGIREVRSITSFEREREIKFGINFLDDAMTCISPSDLILIGARSGAGKTELATTIGMNAAMQGKRVYFFALEAERHELSMRIAYKAAAKKYYKDKNTLFERVSFDRWMAGKQSDRFYEDHSEAQEIAESLKNFKVRYSDTDYTIENFTEDMEQIKNDADLIILDHLHYFEILNDKNENQEYKRIMKTLRRECLDKKIPVILVSHIRKPDMGRPSITPDQEDFHGSSDIIKIATKAITIGSGVNRLVVLPDGEEVSFDGKILSFLRVVKHRRNGSVTNRIAAVGFDPRVNTYGSDYFLGTIGYCESRKKHGINVDEMASLPLWAENAFKFKPKVPDTKATTKRSPPKILDVQLLKTGQNKSDDL